MIGYGASAVNGYLAQDTIFELVDEGLLDKDYYAAIEDYNDGILHGIVKIASKWEFQQFNHIGVHRTSKQSV